MKQYDFSIRQSGARFGNNVQRGAVQFSSPSTFIEPKMKVHNQGNFYKNNSAAKISSRISPSNTHTDFAVSSSEGSGDRTGFKAQAAGHENQNNNLWSSIPSQVKVPQFVKPLDSGLATASNFIESSEENREKVNHTEKTSADGVQKNKQSDTYPKCGKHHSDKSKCDKLILKDRNHRSEYFGDEMLLIFLLLMLSGEKSNSCLLMAILYIFM